MSIEKPKHRIKYLIKRYFRVDNSPYLEYGMDMSEKREGDLYDS